MSNGDTFRNVLGEHKILNVVFQRFKNALMREEGAGHSRWHDRMNPGFPFTDPRSLFFICHVIDLCQRWTTEWHKWNANGCWSAYMCRPEASRRGELVPRTWADFLDELRGIVQMGGFATNLEATFRDLARAVLCLVGWLQGDPECNQTGETVRRFVHLVAQALRVPPLIAPVPQPRRVENAGGEGSGSPVASPQPSPVALPQPSPVASPQPSPVASPQPSPVASPQPSPVASPQPSPVASPQPSPTQKTNPKGRSSGRRSRGLSYEEEVARAQDAINRYNLRSTQARQERLARMKEENDAKRKKEEAKGSSSKASQRRSKK